MKLTDLNFKVLTPTPERARKLLTALTKAGIPYAEYATEPTAVSIEKGLFHFWRSSDVDGFDKDSLPEVTFIHALKLLAQVEASDPTFDIKLEDRVLTRDDNQHPWEYGIYTRVGKVAFHTTGEVWYKLIPFKGNEHLHGQTTTPDGWWEVESGQPVWRRK